MIKAVVFDLDHTLYDRYATLRIVEKKIRSAFDINPELSDGEITDIMIYSDRYYVHKGWDALQKYIINETPLFLTKPGFDKYKEFVMGEFMNTAVKYPFAKPMLDSLRKNGLLTGLITNGRASLQERKLELLGIGDCFDSIYIGGKEGVSKPSVKPFIVTAERLNISTSEMVYVGDNPENDVDASRRAGCVPIFVNTTGTWVLPEIPKPEYSVENVAEIPALIEKMNSDLNGFMINGKNTLNLY